MRTYKLYLPSEDKQDVICARGEHLFRMIDREFQEVRVYTAGLDFSESDAKHPLPYAVLDGKKKSFESLWDKIIVKTGLARDDYVPNYDD